MKRKNPDTPKGCPDRIRWLPECNSMRTRQGWIEPEIYFRVSRGAGEYHNVSPMATYREQTVEIALGPKGAF